MGIPASTVGSSTSMTAAHEQTLVSYDGHDDPYNPRNWSTMKKLWTTMIYSGLTMATAWSSAMCVLVHASLVFHNVSRCTDTHLLFLTWREGSMSVLSLQQSVSAWVSWSLDLSYGRHCRKPTGANGLFWVLRSSPAFSL